MLAKHEVTKSLQTGHLKLTPEQHTLRRVNDDHLSGICGVRQPCRNMTTSKKVDVQHLCCGRMVWLRGVRHVRCTGGRSTMLRLHGRQHSLQSNLQLCSRLQRGPDHRSKLRLLLSGGMEDRTEHLRQRIEAVQHGLRIRERLLLWRRLRPRLWRLRARLRRGLLLGLHACLPGALLAPVGSLLTSKQGPRWLRRLLCGMRLPRRHILPARSEPRCRWRWRIILLGSSHLRLGGDRGLLWCGLPPA